MTSDQNCPIIEQQVFVPYNNPQRTRDFNLFTDDSQTIPIHTIILVGLFKLQGDRSDNAIFDVLVYTSDKVDLSKYDNIKQMNINNKYYYICDTIQAKKIMVNEGYTYYLPQQESFDIFYPGHNRQFYFHCAEFLTEFKPEGSIKCPSEIAKKLPHLTKYVKDFNELAKTQTTKDLIKIIVSTFQNLGNPEVKLEYNIYEDAGKYIIIFGILKLINFAKCEPAINLEILCKSNQINKVYRSNIINSKQYYTCEFIYFTKYNDNEYRTLMKFNVPDKTDKYFFNYKNIIGEIKFDNIRDIKLLQTNNSPTSTEKVVEAIKIFKQILLNNKNQESVNILRKIEEYEKNESDEKRSEILELRHKYFANRSQTVSPISPRIILQNDGESPNIIPQKLPIQSKDDVYAMTNNKRQYNDNSLIQNNKRQCNDNSPIQNNNDNNSPIRNNNDDNSPIRNNNDDNSPIRNNNDDITKNKPKDKINVMINKPNNSPIQNDITKIKSKNDAITNISPSNSHDSSIKKHPTDNLAKIKEMIEQGEQEICKDQHSIIEILRITKKLRIGYKINIEEIQKLFLAGKEKKATELAIQEFINSINK